MIFIKKVFNKQAFTIDCLTMRFFIYHQINYWNTTCLWQLVIERKKTARTSFGTSFLPAR